MRRAGSSPLGLAALLATAMPACDGQVVPAGDGSGSSTSGGTSTSSASTSTATTTTGAGGATTTTTGSAGDSGGTTSSSSSNGGGFGQGGSGGQAASVDLDGDGWTPADGDCCDDFDTWCAIVLIDRFKWGFFPITPSIE